MSDKWEVVEKQMDIVDQVASVATLGLWTKLQDIRYHYIVRNRDTNKTKKVIASDGYELGDKIAEGDFEEE